VLYFGYFALFEIIWNGQTPGKRKAGDQGFGPAADAGGVHRAQPNENR